MSGKYENGYSGTSPDIGWKVLNWVQKSIGVPLRLPLIDCCASRIRVFRFLGISLGAAKLKFFEVIRLA
jgi:hypothetical protein